MFITSSIIDVFSSATKSKDDFLKEEVLVSKIGETLAKDRPDLFKLLQERQISVNQKDTDNVIVSNILEQITRSDDFAQNFMKFLLSKEQKGEGFYKSSEGQKIIKSGADSLKRIAIKKESLKNIVESKNQHSFLMADGDIKPLSSYNWVFNGIIIVGIIYVGYQLYQINKTRKSLNKGVDTSKGEGTDIDTNIDTNADTE